MWQVLFRYVVFSLLLHFVFYFLSALLYLVSCFISSILDIVAHFFRTVLYSFSIALGGIFSTRIAGGEGKHAQCQKHNN